MDIGAGAGAILVSIVMTVLGLLCNGAWRCSPAQRRERRRLVEVERKYLEAKAAVEKVTEEIEAEEDAAELLVEFENSRTSYREHVPFEVKARVVAGRVSPAKGL